MEMREQFKDGTSNTLSRTGFSPRWFTMTADPTAVALRKLLWPPVEIQMLVSPVALKTDGSLIM
jgi:hypothetical protein